MWDLKSESHKTEKKMVVTRKELGGEGQGRCCLKVQTYKPRDLVHSLVNIDNSITAYRQKLTKRRDLMAPTTKHGMTVARWGC